MRLFDTHSHIHDHEFDGDRDAMLARARAAGVAILTLGVDRADGERALALAAAHEDVYAAVGVHPHDAAKATDADLDAIASLARDSGVVAVGEIGLDFYRNLSPHERQVAVLRRQLAIAARVGKPVAVHAREAHDAMEPLLREWSREMGGRLPDGRPLGVMHYFSGDAALAQRYIALGFVISIHTSVTHPKSEVLREVVRRVALEHLVIETDSPYGAPQRYRGRRNEPAYVVEAAACIAELKAMPVEAVAEVTTATARRLFGLTDGVVSREVAAAGGAR
jgi:TatD DNase family protein